MDAGGECVDGNIDEDRGNLCSMRGVCDTARDPPFLRVTLSATAITLTTIKVYIPGGYQKEWIKNMEIYAGLPHLCELLTSLALISDPVQHVLVETPLSEHDVRLCRGLMRHPGYTRPRYSCRAAGSGIAMPTMQPGAGSAKWHQYNLR